MHALSLFTLKAFWAAHPRAEKPLPDRHEITSEVEWRGPAAVLAAFPTADVVGGNRVIATIRGGEFRLAVHFKYRSRIAILCFVGTHRQYDAIVTLVMAYEARHAAVPDTDPVSVLQFAVEGMGRSRAELASSLGSASRASEVLNRRRPLTLDVVRAISDAWTIPRDALTDAYALAGASTGEQRQRKRRPVPDAA